MKNSAVRDGRRWVHATEVLAAMMILSVAVIGMLSAIGASIVASDVQRKSVTADTLVQAYAEGLNAAPYADCATPANVRRCTAAEAQYVEVGRLAKHLS